MLDEHFRIAGRKKWYEYVEEMQKDLHSFLKTYNERRSHQGRGMMGRTPYKAFVEGLPKPDKEAAQKAA